MALTPQQLEMLYRDQLSGQNGTYFNPTTSGMTDADITAARSQYGMGGSNYSDYLQWLNAEKTAYGSGDQANFNQFALGSQGNGLTGSYNVNLETPNPTPTTTPTPTPTTTNTNTTLTPTQNIANGMSPNGDAFYDTDKSSWGNTAGPIDVASLTPEDKQFLQYMMRQNFPGQISQILKGSSVDVRNALNYNAFDPTDGGMSYYSNYDPTTYKGQLSPYFTYNPDANKNWTSANWNSWVNPWTFNAQASPTPLPQAFGGGGGVYATGDATYANGVAPTTTTPTPTTTPKPVTTTTPMQLAQTTPPPVTPTYGGSTPLQLAQNAALATQGIKTGAKAASIYTGGSAPSTNNPFAPTKQTANPYNLAQTSTYGLRKPGSFSGWA